MSNDKPQRRPSTAATIGSVIVGVMVAAVILVPIGIFLTRLAAGWL
jgi:hypothetical protein